MTSPEDPYPVWTGEGGPVTHCDQPIAIVALLATPEAARPAITSRVPGIAPIRRAP